MQAPQMWCVNVWLCAIVCVCMSFCMHVHVHVHVHACVVIECVYMFV